MTYQHALQYLCQTADRGQALLPLDALRDHIALPAASELVAVYVSHDKQGSATAHYLRSILQAAGVSCLHVIYDEDVSPRERFILDGEPISPTLLCPPAHTLRALEASLRRSHPSYKEEGERVVFSPDLRRAAVLLACAKERQARVLLLEGNAPSPDVEAFARLLGGLRGITLASVGQIGLQAALATLPRCSRILSHAPGGEAYRKLSDACAQSGARLSIIADAKICRQSLTPGSQIISDDDLPPCRICPGTSQAAHAAVLAARGARALVTLGLCVSDEDICRGLERAGVPNFFSLRTICPVRITDLAATRREVEQTLADFRQVCAHMERPHAVFVDPALGLMADSLESSGIDSVSCDTPPREIALPCPDTGTYLFIGGSEFLSKLPFAAVSGQKAAKKS